MKGWLRYEDEYELRVAILELFEEETRGVHDRRHGWFGTPIRRERHVRFRSRDGSDLALKKEIWAANAAEKEAKKSGRKSGRVKKLRKKVSRVACRRCRALSPTHRCPGVSTAA